MGFRYDINLLRAISVIGVVLYHFELFSFTGGYAGVDVFFVISGYLMSKIILNSFDNNTFHLKRFYYNRFNRIVPPLVILIFIVLVLANLVYFPDTITNIANNALSSTLFLSNIAYYFQSDYFNTASHNNPLLHTWSLSVEWQFYLIFPLLLLLFKKNYFRKKIYFQLIIFLIILISFVSIYVISGYDKSLSFYIFPTRAWELMVGTLVYVNEDKIKHRIPILLRKICAVLGYILILYFMIFYDDSLLWPSKRTLIPVIGAVLVIVSNVDKSVFIRNKLFKYIGDISYSWYLWHWPIFVMIKALGYDSKYAIVLNLGIGLLLAILSYEFIEKKRKLINVRLSFCYFCVIIFSVFLMYYPINKLFISSEILLISNYKERYLREQHKEQFISNCFLASDKKINDYSKSQCMNLSADKKNILLIGDSHAAEFNYSLNTKLDTDKYNIIEIASSYVFPVINPEVTTGREDNAMLINYAYDIFIPQNNESIDLVIVAACWSAKTGYGSDIEVKNKILELISYFNKNNIEYIIIGETEYYKMDFPDVLAKTKLYNTKISDYVKKDSYEMNNILKSTIPKRNYVDLFNNTNIKKYKGDVLYMFDDNHLSIYGTDQVVDFMIDNGFIR